MKTLNCPLKDCNNKVEVSAADLDRYDQGQIACSEHSAHPQPESSRLNRKGK